MDKVQCTGLANVLMHHSANLYGELHKELAKRKLNVINTGDGPRLVTSTKGRRALASLENTNRMFKQKCIITGKGMEYDQYYYQMKNVHKQIKYRTQDMRRDFEDILY